MAAPSEPNPAPPNGPVANLERIRGWIELNAPPDYSPVFAPPTPPEEIELAAQQIGVDFHPHLRALLAFTNGVGKNAPSFAGAFRLMSVNEIVEAYDFLFSTFPGGENIEHPDHEPIDADLGIRAKWWWPAWVPFMVNGGGDYLCIDMDPAPGGKVGQVVAYYHDETFRSRYAADIPSLFAQIAHGLEAGTHVLHPDYRMIFETD